MTHNNLTQMIAEHLPTTGATLKMDRDQLQELVESMGPNAKVSVTIFSETFSGEEIINVDDIIGELLKEMYPEYFIHGGRFSKITLIKDVRNRADISLKDAKIAVDAYLTLHPKVVWDIENPWNDDEGAESNHWSNPDDGGFSRDLD